MLPSTVPRTLTDLDLISPRMEACSPMVRLPVESIVPSTSPSIKSSLVNFTVPLILTPLERRPPDWVGVVTTRPLPLDCAGRGGGVEGSGSGLRVENIFMREFLQAA